MGVAAGGGQGVGYAGDYWDGVVEGDGAMSAEKQRYEYRYRIERPGRMIHTPWQERPITAEEWAEWGGDFGGCDVAPERRRILYGEPEEFLP